MILLGVIVMWMVMGYVSSFLKVLLLGRRCMSVYISLLAYYFSVACYILFFAI